MGKTLTKGNIVVEDIKIGDIHFQFEYNAGLKCKVLTLPVRDGKGVWRWRSQNLKTGQLIEYMVTEGLSHYSPNLYDYEAYSVKTWV